MTNEIRGAGGKGGGGAGRPAQETPDNLKSIAYARVLDLICEGEIEGLVDGPKSVYLDGTPLMSADGKSNFDRWGYSYRLGTQGQAHLENFTVVESESQVGIRCRADTAAPVRRVTNSSADWVRVTIGIPQLTEQDASTGDIKGTSVEIEIALQSNNGGYVAQVYDKITGKTTSRYQKSYMVKLTGSAPWDIRVRRITPDAPNLAFQNETWWDSYTEIVDAKLRYPNSALVGMWIDAKQFPGIPTRGYDMKLLRVKIPVNYDPSTRTYTGLWNGTFKIAWTDNPAWCFYDLLTNSRYGLGSFVPESQVDKWALYKIAQYCDELVPDGFGGLEPRFTCNVYIQTREEAFKVVNDMASIFRSIVYWSSGSIVAVQDAPSDPAYLYTPANVIDGLFTYSGSSAKVRHTVALVSWNDPEDLYRQKIEYVEDRDGIARYGVVETQIAAVGCTSRGQAHRVGKWLLLSERLESDVVSFTVGLDGAIARPGQIIKIADPSRAGVRLGGRIVAASATTVTLDNPVTLAAGQTYTLAVLTQNGTVEERTVTTAAGSVSAVTVSPGFTQAPDAMSVWILSSQQVEAQLFRVVAVTEDEKHQFTINALAHDPSKYAAIEQNLTLQPRSISVITLVPIAPTNLRVTESLYRRSSGIVVRLTASWTPVDRCNQYAVTVQVQDGNAEPERIVSSPSIDIDVIEGAYTVSVAAISAIGVRGPASSAQYLVVGKTAPPENVGGFVVARNKDVLNFSWRHVSDVDLDHYEIRQGLSWNTGVQIGATVSNSFSWSSPRGGDFMLKAVDTSGNYSASEAVVSVPDSSGINVVATSSEEARNWNGIMSSMIRSGTAVVVNGSVPWSAYTQPWSAYGAQWIMLDPALTGTYETQPIDIGYVASSAVSIENVVEAVQRQPPWSAFTDPWNTYAAPQWSWQGMVAGISASFEVSTSENGSTWSPWQPFTPGAYTFRYLRVRATLTTDNITILPYLTRLIVRIDVPDRVLHFGDVAIPIGGATLTFSPAFVGVQTVQVTLQSAASGDRFTVTGKSNSAVTVQVFDSAGSPKAGMADIDAFGYGERF